MMPLMALLLGNGITEINPHSQVVEAYVYGEKRLSTVTTICQKDREGRTLFLEPQAAFHFREMMGDAAKSGFFLKVVSAFRTHQQQRALKRRRPSYAASPGWSHHQQGLSVDIAGTTRAIKGKKHRTILYWWLVKNAKNYGFFNDVPNEPWHWTYGKRVRNYG
tara:strand:+ start:4835 stop:5323 length:489 start_codon:yes stop_codon:yes gene_type:complete